MKKILFIALISMTFTGCAKKFVQEHCTTEYRRLPDNTTLVIVECDSLYKTKQAHKYFNKVEIKYDVLNAHAKAVVIAKDSAFKIEKIVKLLKKK